MRGRMLMTTAMLQEAILATSLADLMVLLLLLALLAATTMALLAMLMRRQA